MYPEFTAETFCVINTGEIGWCVKHGDDTMCDTYGSDHDQQVLAEGIATFLNGTQASGSKRLIVEYLTDVGISEVEYFACWADDIDHAKEQCEDAYPGCTVTAIFSHAQSYT
jgi:hypothetical protein